MMFIDHMYSTEDIIKCADLAMYQAKNDGRNLIRFFEPGAPTETGWHQVDDSSQLAAAETAAMDTPGSVYTEPGVNEFLVKFA